MAPGRLVRLLPALMWRPSWGGLTNYTSVFNCETKLRMNRWFSGGATTARGEMFNFILMSWQPQISPNHPAHVWALATDQEAATTELTVEVGKNDGFVAVAVYVWVCEFLLGGAGERDQRLSGDVIQLWGDLRLHPWRPCATTAVGQGARQSHTMTRVVFKASSSFEVTEN